MPTARELGVAVVPWSPLGHGALTATVTSRDELPETDVRRQVPYFSEEHFDANRATLETVRRIAAEVEAEPGQVALAWLLHQGDDVVPIPGTRRERYLEQNAAAAFVALTPDQWRQPPVRWRSPLGRTGRSPTGIRPHGCRR
ncbi:aldo/keto reductase [Streptomyces sp. NPDC093065]|uniref:aldo/keto reductase n=1 Tax=Streptomyces sp. NPDC093065 TaxID=3366021 RepID=UPI00380C347A